MENEETKRTDWLKRTRPALIGGIAGTVFYFGFVYGLRPVVFPDAPIGRIFSSPVNLFTLIAFGIAVSILVTLWRRLLHEEQGFSLLTLDDDADAVLLPEDALEQRKKLHQLDESQREFIVLRLLNAGLQRARANWSAQDIGEAVKTQAELIHGEQESEYSLVRYLAWAIPSIGFIGTVLGIGNAMGAVKGKITDAKTADAIGHLHTAFDTTLVALVLSAAVMYLLHRVQANGDSLIIRATDWCMQRFVFRMHIPKGTEV